VRSFWSAIGALISCWRGLFDAALKFAGMYSVESCRVKAANAALVF
jgi:hypothetical protein